MEKVYEESEGDKGLEVVDDDVTNIAGMSRMTHNGRIYTLEFNMIPQASTKESTISALATEFDVVQSKAIVEF